MLHHDRSLMMTLEHGLMTIWLLLLFFGTIDAREVIGHDMPVCIPILSVQKYDRKNHSGYFVFKQVYIRNSEVNKTLMRIKHSCILSTFDSAFYAWFL